MELKLGVVMQGWGEAEDRSGWFPYVDNKKSFIKTTNMTKCLKRFSNTLIIGAKVKNHLNVYRKNPTHSMIAKSQEILNN